MCLLTLRRNPSADAPLVLRYQLDYYFKVRKNYKITHPAYLDYTEGTLARIQMPLRIQSNFSNNSYEFFGTRNETASLLNLKILEGVNW